ncbi:MAG: PAS domain S-box protein, partial [Methanomicrobiales archaeon]|nr:PAS domain S-box protein [Methanomicrobiales archaeon]
MISILYVDDERELLELAKVFLEQSPDFHVDIQNSAGEALALPGIGNYDAIISDYQMPDTDGIAFLKAIRASYGTIPFILFTGRGREEIVIEAINNGADFYLQKGGDVKSQFAELSHKIRQAVARRKAEISVIESEKRLSDIINFLPDATFAIDSSGIIIAWNRAIEEITGFSSKEMIGKGNFEYAIPFYGDRRPILINLLLRSDEELARRYMNIIHDGTSISAETNLAHVKGIPFFAQIKVSPLFNPRGEITGAIESIRDITNLKKAEDELRAAYAQITASEEELREQLEVVAASEQKNREYASRLEFMLGFYERAGASEKELMDYAVEGAGIVTGSPLGYLAFLNDDESELSMYAWSRSAMEECRLRDKPIVYKTAKTGLWGEAVRHRKPIITNDYAAPNPAKKGYP